MTEKEVRNQLNAVLKALDTVFVAGRNNVKTLAASMSVIEDLLGSAWKSSADSSDCILGGSNELLWFLVFL